MAEVTMWCSLVWLQFIWNAVIFYHLSYIGIVHTTSEVHSSHIIHTLTSKSTERQGFTPVTPHRDVQTEHVPSPQRSLGNHIGHPLDAGHDRDSPPHHISTAGDFGIHLICLSTPFSAYHYSSMYTNKNTIQIYSVELYSLSRIFF